MRTHFLRFCSSLSYTILLQRIKCLQLAFLSVLLNKKFRLWVRKITDNIRLELTDVLKAVKSRCMIFLNAHTSLIGDIRAALKTFIDF